MAASSALLSHFPLCLISSSASLVSVLGPLPILRVLCGSDLGAHCLVSSTAPRLQHWDTGTNSRWLQHQTCVILMEYFTQSDKESLSCVKLIWLFRLKARVIISYVFSNLSKYSFPSNQWHNRNSRFPNSSAFTRPKSFHSS